MIMSWVTELNSHDNESTHLLPYLKTMAELTKSHRTGFRHRILQHVLICDSSLVAHVSYPSLFPSVNDQSI